MKKNKNTSVFLKKKSTVQLCKCKGNIFTRTELEGLIKCKGSPHQIPRTTPSLSGKKSSSISLTIEFRDEDADEEAEV